MFEVAVLLKAKLEAAGNTVLDDQEGVERHGQ